MCGGPEASNKTKSTTQSNPEETKDMNNNNNLSTPDPEESFTSLLELASNNDVEALRLSIDRGQSLSINDVGVWYTRGGGTNSKQIVQDHRTPLMVAATYGSLEVLSLILSLPEADVNVSCGPRRTTALHCAASGGSINAVEVIKLLLSAGADPCALDAEGNRPGDVIVSHPKLQAHLLDELLSPEKEAAMSLSLSVSPPTMGELSPIVVSERKEYPIDPSIPDIKNGMYSTDEFRMFSFKVRPCSRAYSHDWTECPFVHPGENARRRDPRKFHYSCVPCPEFRKGSCRRGDLCEYAHGVFECWLHPAQYRTRLCKDGVGCNRRVCFFAHRTDELRPLYVSTGSASSAVPSPRAAAMDMAAALSLLPGSPSAPFGQPMSPSAAAAAVGWPQPNVPTLHLPGSMSRLRSSLNARDIPPEELNMLLEFELSGIGGGFSQPRPSPGMGRSGRPKSLTPANLDELFSSAAAAEIFSPTRKSALLNQFQIQQQSLLSPINTGGGGGGGVLSPKSLDHHHHHNHNHQVFHSPGGRMSPRSVEPISPMGRLSAAISQRDKQLRSLSSRDLGSNMNNNANNGAGFVGSPVSPWSKWGSPNGKLDWSVNGDGNGNGNGNGRMKRSSSFEMLLGNNGEEPDLSWVQSLVKESPPEMMKENAAAARFAPAATSGGEGLSSGSQSEAIDHSVLGAWVEQMQLA